MVINISKPQLRKETLKEVEKVIDSCYLANGPYVKEFEKLFSKYVGMKYGIAMNSGTSALHSAVAALQIKNKYVIVPAMTFIASANAVIMAGAKPQLVDIKEEDFCIDENKLDLDLNKVGAIMGVSMYGQVFDYKIIQDIIFDTKIKLIEDASHSVGATGFDKKSCGFADISCASLYSTKNLFCGEGGIATTNDKKIAEYMTRFRQHSQSKDGAYDFEDIGYNFKMPEVSAVFAIDQLEILDKLITKRRKNAKYYTRSLQHVRGLKLPKEKKGVKHAYHQYVVLVDKNEFGMDRDQLNKFMNENGVQTRIHYPKPIHLCKFYKDMGYKKGDFPVAEKVAKTCLSLPVHPYLSNEELRTITRLIK